MRTDLRMSFLLAALLGLTFLFTGCDEDAVTPAESDTTVYPTPDDAFGVLTAIKTFTDVEVGGFTTSVEFGTAVAVFIESGAFLNGGTVTADGEMLTLNDNNSYAYIPDFGTPSAATGITFGNDASWSVSGNGSVPAFTGTFNGFPSKPVVTSTAAVDRSSAYTMTWNSVTGADSLIVSVFGSNAPAMKTVAGNATSATFSSAELSDVGATDFGILQVAAYVQTSDVVSGKKIYYNNESVGSVTGVEIN